METGGLDEAGWGLVGNWGGKERADSVLGN